MPKHRPIKFETTLETTFRKELLKNMKENKKAKTALNATLALIAMGGVLTFAVMAPNLLSAFTRMAQSQKKKRYEEYQKLWQNFNKLKKRGDLEFVIEDGDYLVYRPTKKGKEKIKKLILGEMVLTKPRRWDGKWRLVIFDIPESCKKARQALREKLKELSFYQCQKSVWIHPFPCLEEVEFLKDFFHIKPFVKLFLVEEMTDGKVLYHFKDILKDAMRV